MDRDCKPYCREGESESYIALAWVVVATPILLFLWVLFFVIVF